MSTVATHVEVSSPLVTVRLTVHGPAPVAFAGVTADVGDVNVRPGLEGQGIGGAMLSSLKAELRRIGVERIDTATHFDNPGARRFYERHGFASLREERMSCLL